MPHSCDGVPHNEIYAPAVASPVVKAAVAMQCKTLQQEQGVLEESMKTCTCQSLVDVLLKVCDQHVFHRLTRL